MGESESVDKYKNEVLQKELLRRGITYPSFAREILKKSCPEVFAGHEDYWLICKVINYYYNTSTEPISQQVLLQRVIRYGTQTKAIETEDDMNRYATAVQDIVNSEPDNSEGMLLSLDEYFKSVLNWKALSEEVNKAFASGDKALTDRTVNKIRDRFDKNDLISITGSGDNFLDVIDGNGDDYLDLLSSLWQDRIPTGFAGIDRILGGGLAKGEVGLIGALYGSGKTLMLNSLASNYAHENKNVLYVALEEKKNRMYFRFLQCLSNTPGSEFYNTDTHMPNVVKLGEEVKNLRNDESVGKFYFYRQPPHTLSIDGLEQVIAKIQLINSVKLDVVIIDYPDLLINNHAIGDVSEDGGTLYEYLRKMGQDFDVITWLATQLNRGSQSADTKTMEFVEGSKKKLNAVEFAATINATKDERMAGYLRLHIDKVRNPEGYAEFVGLKVEGDRQKVRDYKTDDERRYHESLVEEAGSSVKAERQKKWSEKNQKKVESENSKAATINQAFNFKEG